MRLSLILSILFASFWITFSIALVAHGPSGVKGIVKDLLKHLRSAVIDMAIVLLGLFLFVFGWVPLLFRYLQYRFYQYIKKQVWSIYHTPVEWIDINGAEARVFDALTFHTGNIDRSREWLFWATEYRGSIRVSSVSGHRAAPPRATHYYVGPYPFELKADKPKVSMSLLERFTRKFL